MKLIPPGSIARGLWRDDHGGPGMSESRPVARGTPVRTTIGVVACLCAGVSVVACSPASEAPLPGSAAAAARPAPAMSSSSAAPSATPLAERSTVDVWIGGDVHLGASPAHFELLEPGIGGAHGIVNLEGPVDPEPTHREGGTVVLSNDPRVLGSLARAGVKAAGIANNHTGDHGADGSSRTADALTRAGIVPVGAGAAPAVLTLDGVRVAVTAHDLSSPAPATLGSELEGARASADVLIATFHVTGPPSYLPRPELRAAVQIALDAGAHVVAAHGTHVIGPLERRGRAVIAWGLGNLSFDCDCTDQVDGAILRVTLGGAEVAARVVPIDAGLAGKAARLSHDPAFALDLFEAIGSEPLRRDPAAGWASF